MALNDQLLEAQDGDTTTKFKITGLKGAQLSSGGSGHVPPGNYKLLIKSAKIQKKKDKPGKNIVIEYSVTEPAAFAGVPIVGNHPAPQGEAMDTGMQTMRNIVISSSSFKGTLDKLLATEELDFSPGDFVGRTVGARVKDGTGQYANRSEIDAFLMKEDYEKAPGPQAGLAQSGAGAGAAQKEVKEVKNGAGSTATKSAVDAALAADI